MDQATRKVIERHNERTRELIVKDIDALENKLNVKRQMSHLKDDAMHKVKGTLGMDHSNRNEGWAGFVKHNAAPLLALGFGGSVVAKNLRSKLTTDETRTFDPTNGGYTRDYSQVNQPTDGEAQTSSNGSGKLDTAKEKVSDLGSSVTGKASDLGSTVSDKASGAKDTVALQAMSAKDYVTGHVPSPSQVGETATEHPQMLGAVALAAGALAGAFVPRTQVEKDKLAPVQEQLKDKASDLVEQGVDTAKEKASQAAIAASHGVETVKEELQGSDDDDDFEPSLSGSTTQQDRIIGSRLPTAEGTTPTTF